jgi:hypothetical protein
VRFAMMRQAWQMELFSGSNEESLKKTLRSASSPTGTLILFDVATKIKYLQKKTKNRINKQINK